MKEGIRSMSDETAVCERCQKPIEGEWLDVDEAMYGFETSYRIHPECWLVSR